MAFVFRAFVFSWLIAASQIAQPDGGGVDRGSLPPSWTTGASCPETPFRTHAYNDDFIILRQSGCTNFEKPFLYLLFGGRSALLTITHSDELAIAQVLILSD